MFVSNMLRKNGCVLVTTFSISNIICLSQCLAATGSVPSLVPLAVLWEVDASGNSSPDYTTSSTSSERDNYPFLGAIAYIRQSTSLYPLYRLQLGADHFDSLTAGEGGASTNGPLGSPWPSSNVVPGLANVYRLQSSQTGDKATTTQSTMYLYNGNYQSQGSLGYGYPRYGNQASNLNTLSDGGIIEYSDSIAGGSISGWIYNNQQFIDTYNYGRYFQSAIFYNTANSNVLFNPTEAGDGISGPQYGAPGKWHGAPTLVNTVANNVHTTRSVPLDYNPPSADTPLTYVGLQLGKDLTLNFQNLGPVGQYKALVHSGVSIPNTAAEVPTAYLNGSFSNYYTYDAGSKNLRLYPLADNCTSPGSEYYTPPSRSGGVVIQDPSTGNAMGIYGSPNSTNGNGTLNYEIIRLNACYNSAKLGMTWQGNINAGDNTFTSYIISGTITQVTGIMSKLYQAGY